MSCAASQIPDQESVAVSRVNSSSNDSGGAPSLIGPSTNATATTPTGIQARYRVISPVSAAPSVASRTAAVTTSLAAMKRTRSSAAASPNVPYALSRWDA